MATYTWLTPTNLRNNSEPVELTDATTKQYVDNAIANVLISNSNLSLSAANNITVTANTGNTVFTNNSNTIMTLLANNKVLMTANMIADTSNGDPWTIYDAGGNIKLLIDNSNTVVHSMLALDGANLGNVANLKIQGGTNGQVLATDGSGNLTWVAQTGGGNGIPAGSPGQLQLNGGNGNFSASANLSFADAANGGVLTAQNIVAPDIFGNMVIRAPLGNIVFSGGAANNFIISANGLFMGDVSKVLIAGGNSGQLLASGGNADLQFVNPVTPGGTDTQLQFNDKGAFAGITGVTWNGNTLNLGNVANVRINGGSNTQLLTTDGAGNLSWTTPVLTNPVIGATLAVTGSGPANTILNGTRYWLGNVEVSGFSWKTNELQMQNSTLGQWTYVGGGTAVFNVTFTSVFNGTGPDQIRVSLVRDNADLVFAQFVTTNPTSGPGGGIVNLSGTVTMSTNQTLSVQWINNGTTVSLTDTQLTITRLI